jgi:hypothetical protein
MASAAGKSDEKAGAAVYFLKRAQAAVEAADTARTEDAAAAFYKEAETWLYMARQCLNPDGGLPAPGALPAPSRRAAGERRSFRPED